MKTRREGGFLPSYWRGYACLLGTTETHVRVRPRQSTPWMSSSSTASTRVPGTYGDTSSKIAP